MYFNQKKKQWCCVRKGVDYSKLKQMLIFNTHQEWVDQHIAYDDDIGDSDDIEETMV